MANALTNKQKKDWAKLLYLKEGLQYQVIAVKVGVNRITVGRWAKEEDWESLRNAYTLSKENSMQEAAAQLAELNKTIKERDVKIPTSKEADIISKLRKTIKETSEGITAAEAMDFTQAFLGWLSGREPEVAAEISYYLEDYVKTLL